MIKFEDIREVHLEISSLCNARCPLCPRNFYGYPYNDGYQETNLTLESVKRIFSEDFVKQLNMIWINGNFGDAVMNPETPNIVEYFKTTNPDIAVEISTNGSARDSEFWTKLARLGAKVYFCLDGLEDTHSLYRVNTNYHTILKNAQTFINAGGVAIWKMIPFDHNRHQIDECKNTSTALGFSGFWLTDHGRNTGPVFDTKGNLTHTVGNYQGEKTFEILFHKRKTDTVLVEDIASQIKDTIKCETQWLRSIYISSTGDVYPCCYTGLSPNTYGHGNYLQAVNSQLRPLVKNNNALTNSLEECINWFSQVEETWTKSNFSTGRLLCCNDNCGI